MSGHFKLSLTIYFKRQFDIRRKDSIRKWQDRPFAKSALHFFHQIILTIQQLPCMAREDLYPGLPTTFHPPMSYLLILTMNSYRRKRFWPLSHFRNWQLEIWKISNGFNQHYGDYCYFFLGGVDWISISIKKILRAIICSFTWFSVQSKGHIWSSMSTQAWDKLIYDFPIGVPSIRSNRSMGSSFVWTGWWLFH